MKKDTRPRVDLRLGRVVEDRWLRMFPNAVKSTDKEDIWKHIDFWHGDIGVDVKGNNLPDEIWVEFINVRGRKGWLHGEAKYIAFDVPELKGFVRVEREELLEWCRHNVEKIYVSKKNCYKKLYRRYGRKDCITKLTVNDLSELKSYTLINYVSWLYDPLTGQKVQIDQPTTRYKGKNV